MAKLDVRVIESKIEVGGVTYERTDEDVRVGDIVQCFEITIDLTRGLFYKVERIDSDGDFVIIDDAGDRRCREQSDSDFVHFRKVGAETTFKIGDIVEIVDASKGRWHDLNDGDIGKVIEFRETDYPETPIQVETEYDYDVFPAEALRKVEKPAKRPKLAVGDYAKAVDGRWLDEGTIVKVLEIDEGDAGMPYYVVDINDDDNDFWYEADGLIPLTEQTAKWAAIGRKVGEIKKGDIVRVVDGCGGEKNGTIGIAKFDGDYDMMSIIGGLNEDYVGFVELIAPVESVVNLRGAGA